MRLASCCLFLAVLLAAADTACAQSTDGFSSSQILPVVVDTASFVQRINLANKNGSGINTIVPWYYPAAGTPQATPLSCPAFSLAANSEKAFVGLRAICPSLAAGSQFGTLLFRNSDFTTFSVYSRVSNIQGAGFSVEGFPASTFSTGKSVVTGIRRLAAGAGAPAYQTNCFVGIPGAFNVFHDHANTVTVHYTVRNSQSVQIGSGDLAIYFGGLTRVLDIFAAAGVAAGDQDDAAIEFDGSFPYLAFCTVQDNTSFGADFRIAKAFESMSLGLPPNVGANDPFVLRDITWNHDIMGRPFVIPAGQFINSHLFAFHVPDFGQCELVDGFFQRLAPSYGLEMRVVDGIGAQILGGNNSVVVPDPPHQGDSPYFGDKEQRGADSFLILQVESNGQNEAADRPYWIRCRSGSGMSPPQLIEYQRAGSEF